ncbi:cyclic lactone autoinducer peptide [Staphylococcus sp. SQ8-PEA]|uniref:Cyclic lactone autoinducer peptide n=1 Tax=Staphylococcus marylandisciuri TaxID=2981529 RepID=A0ABT2QQA6_9STAP|nr:cyclic lactone autoinducer peptide [Staphylococcus marylandisciuri]MCU5746161.1 cyclic lactone autoinducer peptide [Staphylococcus marylandisciuri]
MALLNYFIHLFIKVCTYIGDKAIVCVCQSWFDEPEVPEELQKIKQ